MSEPPATAPPRRAAPPRLGRGELLLRRALLVVAAAAAAVGVLAGLARLGVDLGAGGAHAPGHGPLLALGLLGTVIPLERAVALGRPWAYASPLLGAAAAVAMLAGHGSAPGLATLSAAALVAVNAAIVRRRAASFTWLMLAASAVLVCGVAAWWAGRPVYEVVHAWTGFLVLTIVAERLEISRLVPMPRWAGLSLVVAAGSFTAFCCAAALGVPLALRGLGAAAVLVGLWQVRFDLARRTLGRPGLPRFAAVGVLLGAGWLVVAGLLAVGSAIPPAGPRYDAFLHALLVGYVLSMIFSHAPFILPAVARIEVPFTALFHVPLAVLQLGLLARVTGDLAGSPQLRQHGSVANAIALLLYVATVLLARRRGPGAAPGRGHGSCDSRVAAGTMQGSARADGSAPT